MICRFLVVIQDGLGFLFPCSYLSGNLTSFGEEQQRKEEHIL